MRLCEARAWLDAVACLHSPHGRMRLLFFAPATAKYAIEADNRLEARAFDLRELVLRLEQRLLCVQDVQIIDEARAILQLSDAEGFRGGSCGLSLLTFLLYEIGEIGRAHV